MEWNTQRKIGNFDALMEVIDWELNVNHEYFGTNSFMEPKPAATLGEMQAEGYIENWICYRSDAFSAKELTVFPGQTVTIKDSAAYGMIMMQGHGKMGVMGCGNACFDPVRAVDP